ncbi:MAG: hypothetical protein JSS61_05880 [Verrucomicrobia bacterium]|nr:hypothetical protein [Verrucomicrobiota bacterium]
MKKNRLRSLVLCILLGTAGYFLFHTPGDVDLSKYPGFFNENCHFFPLKILDFTPANIPEMQMQVENATLHAKVDLGWDGGVVLPRGMIRSLKEKSFKKRKSFFGVRGRSYESDVYELPNINIGKLKLLSVWAEEQNEEFLEDGSIKKSEQEPPEKHFGRIGWQVFKPFNLFLDCDHSIMALCDSLDTIKSQGYSIETFVEAPLLLDRGTIDFVVMTEAGPLRCVLDTGSTWNLLNKDFESSKQDHRIIDLDHLNGKPSEFNPTNEDLIVLNPENQWETKTFQISGIDFGPVDFVKMKSPIGLDAIIGMEFIDEHLIFIDFRNNKIYFSKLPEKRSLFLRAYTAVTSRMGF